MGRYLVSMGHRRAAFLSDNDDGPGVDSARFAGFQRAFREAGLNMEAEDRLRLSRYAAQRRKFYEAKAGELAEKYTALFFASDFYAAEAVNRFFEQGMSIPEDISICGFDDNIFAVQCRPALTTVHQDVPARAELAVNRLAAIIAGENTAGDLRQSVSIVERSSVKCI